MSRNTTSLFKVNGTNMYAPDQDMEFSFEDIDAADAGRDEAGYMHRLVVRYKVGKWSFDYASVTDAELEAIEAMFPDAGTFQFTHPSRTDISTSVTTECYRSKYSITWKNSRTGKWRNYKFNIIEV